MSYSLEVEEKCGEAIRQLVKKNKSLETAMSRAIERILANPEHFKSLRWPLQSLRRVHVLGSFVLVYEIFEAEKKVRLLRFAHHDEAYRH